MKEDYDVYQNIIKEINELAIETNHPTISEGVVIDLNIRQSDIVSIIHKSMLSDSDSIIKTIKEVALQTNHTIYGSNGSVVDLYVSKSDVLSIIHKSISNSAKGNSERSGMKVGELVNLWVGYNSTEDFRVLICALDKFEAQDIANEYCNENHMSGVFGIIDFTGKEVFDCDYVLTHSKE